MSRSLDTAQQAVDEPLEDSEQGNDSHLWFLVLEIWFSGLGRKSVALHC